jgi:ribosomal protein S12 methylthiotransferase accessory factor
VERYSALNTHGAADGFLLTPRESCLIERFPLCAPDEPCRPSFRGLNPNLPLTHVMARRLSDGVEVPVPAAHLHLNFWPQPPEPQITEPLSTGLAFHPELHQSLWNGLCEVAERDALMLMWWNRRPLTELRCDTSDLPGSLATRLERLRHVGLVAHLFDMTTDYRVPTVFCVLVGERFPYFVTGAACRADPVAACTKAVDEAVSTRQGACKRVRPEALPSPEHHDRVCSLEDHAILYPAGATHRPWPSCFSRTGPSFPWTNSPTDLGGRCQPT